VRGRPAREREVPYVSDRISYQEDGIQQMKTIARNALAVLAGIAVGSLVNMGLVNIGPLVVPLPEGADVSTAEGLRDSMRLFTPVNFIFPFLAHALGTLAGASVAAKLAASHAAKLAIGIGMLFLMGGIAAVIMLGGPLWFIVADLLLAYVPMGYLGAVLAGAIRSKAA
jgi:hypothetical protein